MSAKTKIQKHLKETREANAQAHAGRMDACAAAAERTPMTESEAAAAGDAWINSKPGRKDRYGVVEATGFEHEGRIGLTTTNFFDLSVDVLTGKVKFEGINPNRPQTLKLTSPAKMGAARKGKKATPVTPSVVELLDLDATALTEAKAELETVTAAAEGMWAKLTGDVDPALADRMLAMLQSEQGCTGRQVEAELGLNQSDRARVLRCLTNAGWTLSHQPNPDAAKGDPRTRNLYSIVPPAAVS